MFKQLLVPLDGSTFAEGALTYAVSLADAYGSRVTLLRVLPPGAFEWEAEMRAEVPELAGAVKQSESDEAADYLREREERLAARGIDVTAVMMKGRAVAESILQTADEVSADTIIICSHGLTGVQRWLMGSVAERVVRHAEINVVLIRPKQDNQ